MWQILKRVSLPSFVSQFLCLILLLLLTSCVNKPSYIVREREIRREVIVAKKPTPVEKKNVTGHGVPPHDRLHKRELVVLDAGHGGKDTGAKSAKYIYEEKGLTLKTAKIVKAYLSKMGYEVVLTRKQDAYISLEKRAEIANELRAALFVSIHYNYCPNETAEGIEVFYHKDEKNPYTKRLIESKRLGETVLSGIVKHTGATSRGVKRANFAVIRETKMPAVLIEGGFLSNPEERQKILDDDSYLQFLGYGIAAGIDKYLSGR